MGKRMNTRGPMASSDLRSEPLRISVRTVLLPQLLKTLRNDSSCVRLLSTEKFTLATTFLRSLRSVSPTTPEKDCVRSDFFCRRAPKLVFLHRVDTKASPRTDSRSRRHYGPGHEPNSIDDLEIASKKSPQRNPSWGFPDSSSRDHRVRTQRYVEQHPSRDRHRTRKRQGEHHAPTNHRNVDRFVLRDSRELAFPTLAHLPRTSDMGRT